MKSKELDGERRWNGMVLLRTQLFKWVSHLLLCLLCVTCTLWKWRNKTNGHLRALLQVLLWWLRASGGREGWRTKKQEAAAGLITHNICLLNFPPDLGLSPLGDVMGGSWNHLGSSLQLTASPTRLSSHPEGLTETWFTPKILNDVNDPVSAAPLWHSWTLKCSCKHTDCDCGESYLGIHVSSQHRIPFNSVFVPSCHFYVWDNSIAEIKFLTALFCSAEIVSIGRKTEERKI